MSGPTHTVLDLELLKVAGRRYIPTELFQGAQRPMLDLVADETIGSLVAQVNALVLSDYAGDTVHGEVTVKIPQRPWWLPGWLWSRVPVKRQVWHMAVRPRWTYPSANISVPDLGAPVRYVEQRGPRVEREW